MPISHVAAPAQSISEPAKIRRTPLTLTLARQRVALVVMVLTAFALRLFTLDAQSLWRDEVDAIWFALRPLEQTMAMFTQMAQNGPLYFLSLRPWLQLLGSSEFALRLPSAMAGVAAVPLLWLVARRLAGNSAAPILAALFFAINPYALWYGQEGKMYTIITFLALLASWCWLQGVEKGAQDKGWRWWLSYVLAITLAMYFHLLAILIIPLHIIWFAIALPTARKQWKGYALALAALTLPYVPMLVWQWRMLLATEQVTGFTYTPLSEMLKTILLNQARGFMPGDPLIWLSPIYFLGVVGMLIGFTEVRGAKETPAATQVAPTQVAPTRISARRRFLMLVAWAIVPLISIWVISLRQPVFTDRYIIWMLSAVLLLVALGIEVVRANLGRAGLPVALLLVCYVAGFWLYAGWLQTSRTIKYDLRSAIEYVAEARDPHTLLILQIPHLEYAYRYYSSDMGADPFAGSDERLGTWISGLWTNTGADTPEAVAEVDKNMRALTVNYGELWLILSEPDMWDSRHLMDAWLEQNAEVTDAQDYHGVRVRRFTLH